MIPFSAFADELLKIAYSSEASKGLFVKSRGGKRPCRVDTLLSKNAGLITPKFLLGAALASGGILGGQHLAKKFKKFKNERAMIQSLREQGYFDNA